MAREALICKHNMKLLLVFHKRNIDVYKKPVLSLVHLYDILVINNHLRVSLKAV